MLKSRLILIVAIAAIFALYQSSYCVAQTTTLDSLRRQFLPAEFQNQNFSLDELKRLLSEKCKKVTGMDNSTLYKDIEAGAVKLMSCLSSFANISSIQAEIDFARPIGELDTVFHKYCDKAPSAEKCIIEFEKKVQPCLTEEERNQNAMLARVLTGLMGFVCIKGGDQIALFVAEDGPECLEANKEALNACLNSSYSEFLPKDAQSMQDVNNLPQFILSAEHCVGFEKFEKCAVKHLERCTELTPANIAESIFRFIKTETNCKNILSGIGTPRPILKESKGNAASKSHSMLTTIIMTLISVILIIKLV